MPSLNATARNTAVTALTDTYAAATLTIQQGATVLVTHTLAGWNAASGGSRTALAIADSTISATGTANTAKLTAGSNELTLSVGLSGAEVNMSSLDLVSGGLSTITSLTTTFPAS
jgi:hypothetical protein